MEPLKTFTKEQLVRLFTAELLKAENDLFIAESDFNRATPDDGRYTEVCEDYFTAKGKQELMDNLLLRLEAV